MLCLYIIPPRIFSFIPPPSHPHPNPYRQLATIFDMPTHYHSHFSTFSIVTHETSALASSHLVASFKEEMSRVIGVYSYPLTSPTSVLRTSGRERYRRLLQISMLCRHRLSITFILRSLSRKPRPHVLTSEMIMLSASFPDKITLRLGCIICRELGIPWKESTLKHLSAHSRPFSSLSIRSIKLLCPS